MTSTVHDDLCALHDDLCTCKQPDDTPVKYSKIAPTTYDVTRQLPSSIFIFLSSHWLESKISRLFYLNTMCSVSIFHELILWRTPELKYLRCWRKSLRQEGVGACKWWRAMSHATCHWRHEVSVNMQLACFYETGLRDRCARDTHA